MTLRSPHQEPSPRPRTLAVFTEWTAERHPREPALRFRDAGGGWAVVTYAELRETVRRTARGLLALGIGPGERVAILAETRPEWTYTHFAALAVGAVVVPVYPTAGDEETAWVLADSGARAVFCEGPDAADRVARLRPELPALAHVLPLTGPGGPDGSAVPVDDLLARSRAVRPEDDAELVYTSGTTGPPKGCRLTHGNLGAVQDATLHLIDGGPGDRTYLYLPLAHLFAQLIQFSTLLNGGELCYFGGRIEDVLGELAQTQPTHLPSVPRLFEKVYAAARSLAEAREGGAERFDAAVELGVLAADGRLPAERKSAYEAADASLFSLVRAAFGGRLRWAFTGGAPIDPAVLDFLRASRIGIFEGYGMTESAGVISLNHPGAVRYGSVGRPVPGCEVRIAADGEVLARGPMIFPGYHANARGTAQALDAEGWLRTGDLGAVGADGFLTITGRKKDLIITSAGKNLTPSHVELAIERSRFVSHAVMVGDRRPYPVALITVAAEEVAGRDEEEVRALVGEAVAAANARVSRPARIRDFAVLARDFSVEAGELTPTLKVRRAVILERYGAEINTLYP
ncbi:AMP-binding protein [Streptomyces sp. Edi4]|uniref:AMP-dependent synthetase/ligase n=1 Tax=Streptomyces sp. Edi4 TaxID=3162527 RepID=UPI003306380F